MALYDAVFEGGGAKGIAFLGSLEIFTQAGHSFRRLIGTSAGAITASLVAAGYRPDELAPIVLERLPDNRPRFLSFMDAPGREDFSDAIIQGSVLQAALRQVNIPFLGEAVEERIDRMLIDGLLRNRQFAELFSLAERGGIYAGNAFLAWIEEKFAAKGIEPADSFAEFHRKTGVDLSLVATDVTDASMLVLNHRTAPGLPVAVAVRMSMSIPFVWQEVAWLPDWGAYGGRDLAGHVIVDGGVLSNFPIRLLNVLDDHVRPIMGATDPGAAGTVGFLIDETLQVPGEPRESKTPSPISRLKMTHRVSGLLDTMMGAGDNEMIRLYERQIVRHPAMGYGTLEFGMQGDRLNHFLDASRAAMRAHLGL